MLCLTCHRVRPAISRADYTAERAWLIVRRGLCTCAAPPQRHALRRTSENPPDPQDKGASIRNVHARFA